jgi:hypothetical protein
MVRSLLGLPREIRDHIYAEALTVPVSGARTLTITVVGHQQPRSRERVDSSKDNIHPIDYDTTPFRPNVVLLRTCRLVYVEALHLMFAKLIFAFFGRDAWSVLRSFLRRIGLKNSLRIREIHMDSVPMDLTALTPKYKDGYLNKPPGRFEMLHPDLEALSRTLAQMAEHEGGLKRIRLWEAHPLWPKSVRNVFLTLDGRLGRDALGEKAVQIVYETYVQKEDKREKLLTGLKGWEWIVVRWTAPHPRCDARRGVCSSCLNDWLNDEHFL